MSRRTFTYLCWCAVALTLLVIALGAYVRLSHAGLGCPDWPGCYGHVTWPSDDEQIAVANQTFPDRQVEIVKAIKEMLHRYVASALGLLILVLAYVAWTSRADPQVPVRTALGAVALVIFQGLLGMWTVTLLVKPAVVTAHLLGGMATMAVLLWMALRSGASVPAPRAPLRALSYLALAVLVLQIALGGWVSTNYSALACPDFPACQGAWWPQTDFADAFVLWRGLGIDYEGGVLDHPARVAIHLTHRLGAIVATGVLLALAWRSYRALSSPLPALLLVSTLVIQILLGIGNVVLGLPIAVATAHTVVAALLLAAVLNVLHHATLKPVASG